MPAYYQSPIFFMSLFISEISGNTKELKFEVIDKSRPTGGNKLHTYNSTLGMTS